VVAGGGFYCGRILRSVSCQANEPSLVDPTLPLRRNPSEPEVACNDPRPSYVRLSPDQRRVYLEWLSGERSISARHPFCGQLYFFGLERRLLLDTISAEEEEVLCAEVIRIRSDSKSLPRLSDQAERLLHVLAHVHAPTLKRGVYYSASGAFECETGALARWLRQRMREEV
jgi:hypothetical protein